MGSGNHWHASEAYQRDTETQCAVRVVSQLKNLGTRNSESVPSTNAHLQNVPVNP